MTQTITEITGSFGDIATLSCRHVISLDVDGDDVRTTVGDTRNCCQCIGSEEPRFKRGQIVNRKEFTDGRSVFHPAMNGLVVYSTRFIECQSIPSYHRVLAYGPNGEMAEGAEHFFESAE